LARKFLIDVLSINISFCKTTNLYSKQNLY